MHLGIVIYLYIYIYIVIYHIFLPLNCMKLDHFHCYFLTPWCRVLLEKLTGLQLVKKFPAFHGIRRFITALTSVRKPVSILGQPNPVRTPTSHFLEIHPNIIHHPNIILILLYCITLIITNCLFTYAHLTYRIR